MDKKKTVGKVSSSRIKHNSEYYTPSIEEFHVGFEVEFKNVVQGNVLQHDWCKEVCNEDLIAIAFDTYEHEEYKGEFADTFRVKYLDSQDIQELGWQWDEENGVFKISCWFKSRRDYFDIHLHYVSKSCHLLIFEGDFDSVPEKQSSTVFYVGKCYNKSELKWLMDRLGIKTE